MNCCKSSKRIGSAIVSLSIVVLFASFAHAGVKYWDNPAFKAYDADSYVQEGLVLNYDGIRNVGLGEEHSYDTTTWVNLANPGTQNLTKSGSGKNSKWLDDGFFFDGTNMFVNTRLTITAPYETETLIDANCTDQNSKADIGYVMFPIGDDNKNWTKWSLAVRKAATDGIWFNTHYYTSDRPKIKNTESFSYLTALATSSYAAVFSGLNEPAGVTGRYGLKSGTSEIGSFTSDGWGIGGHPSGGKQQLIGTIKNFRHYSRVLSLDERTWNRVVDDYRYFGKLNSSIPATNAVIASSIAIVSGNEPAGAYAVDASGYTFTAPVSTTSNGRAYTCTGYTREEWDDATGDWGAPETMSGNSVAVTANDKVRITWQWTAGDGIVTRYTTADYVQNGLILHYDGIRNLGADQPHSYKSTTWKNIAPNGGYDLTFRLQTDGTKPGEWRDDGYRFEQQSTFTYTSAIDLPSNQTIQIALDANALDQYTFKNGVYANEPYLYYAQGTFGKGAAISLRKDINAAGTSVTSTHFDWPVHGYGDDATRPRPKMDIGAPAQYVTAILADDFGAAMTGTTIPAAETAQAVAGASRRDFTKGPPTVNNASNGFAIGGNQSPTQGKFKGTINNFRLYNRVLSNDELAANRVIDDYRFHGVMPVTNVIVSTSHSFLSGSEKNGNYEISGRYSFTAPTGTQTDSRGFSYDFRGYTLEEWDASTQSWSDPVSCEASAYEYVVGTAAAKVRLTWVWEASGNIRTAKDYGLEDIVPSGLALHYDGIKNIGAECEGTANPTSRLSKIWVNLVDEGKYTLGRVDKTTAAGAWTTDGFAFTNTSTTVGSRFQRTVPFTLTPAYTWQFLVDAKVADQSDGTCGYIMFNDNWRQSSLAIRTNSDYKYGLYYVSDTAFAVTTGDYRPKILDTQDANSKYTYATAILKGYDAMLFAGTEYPADTVGKKTSPIAATAQTLTKIIIGGGQGSQDLTGKVKSIRYYDRVLTPAEMVRNRQVDSVRYFGALAVTNVVVTTKFADVAGDDEVLETAAGEYAVEGSWTFRATTVKGEDGTAVDVVGYSLYRLVDRAWKRSGWHYGNEYTYDADEEKGATVRLVWGPTPSGVIILVR